MFKKSKALAVLGAIALLFSTVVPPQPASADYAVLQKQLTLTSTTVTPAAGLTLTPLTGQSSCTTELGSGGAGTTQVLQNGTWTNVDSVLPAGTGAASPTVTGPGTFIANCAGMQGYRFVPTSITGSVAVSVLANGGVGRILGAGVNGGRTLVVGSGPITVTNSGNTATVGLTTPLTIPQGGTNNTALPSGCLQSNGTVVSSTGTACASGSGTVTAVTGTGNINVTAGATPVVSITDSPTFAGLVTSNQNIVLPGVAGSTAIGYHVGTVNGNFPMAFVAVNNLGSNQYSTMGTLSTSTVSGVSGTCWNWQSDSIIPTTSNIMALDCSGNLGVLGTFHAPTIIDSGLTSGNCVQATTGGQLTTTAGACGTGSGTVTAVTGTGNISSTGGTTPAISITAAPSFTSITATGLTGTACVREVNGLFAAATSDCPVGNNGSFVIPAVGSTVAVSISPVTAFPRNFMPINITDGTHSVDAIITANAGSSTPTLTVTAVLAGAVGNTMAGGAVYTGGGGTTQGTTSVTGTAPISVTAGATPVVSCSTCLTGLTAGNDMVVGTGPTPSVAVTNSPTFTTSVTLGVNGSYSDSGAGQGSFLIGSGATSGFTDFITSNNAGNKVNGVQGNTYCVGQAVANGCVYALDTSGNSGQLGTVTATGATLTGLTTGLCVQTTTGGALTTAAAACGAGTVTSVSGTGNITSTGGTTPTVAITNAPTFTGTLTAGAVISNNLVTATNSIDALNGSSGSTTVGFQAGSFLGNYPRAVTLFNNNAASGNTGIGTNSALTIGGVAGTCEDLEYYVGNTATTNLETHDCAGNVGFAGAVNAAGAVTGLSLTASGLSANRCLLTGTGGLITIESWGCPLGVSTATFVIPAVGSSVTVANGNFPGFTAKNNTPIIITDGTNTMTGLVTAGAGTTSLTVTNTGLIAGAVGNTMANLSYMVVGGYNQDFVYQSGTRLNGNHREMNPSLSVGTATTATFTFATPYNSAPGCTVSTVGALAPTMSINASPTTTAVVIYNSGTAGTASVSCDGW